MPLMHLQAKGIEQGTAVIIVKCLLISDRIEGVQRAGAGKARLGVDEHGVVAKLGVGHVCIIGENEKKQEAFEGTSIVCDTAPKSDF